MKNKAGVMRNMLIAMIGAAICMIACWLSSGLGEGNVTNGLIQSNWVKMSYIRLAISLGMSALGIGMMYPGFRDYARVVKLSRRRKSPTDTRMSKVFDLGVLASVISYLFIQSGSVMIAIVYKELFGRYALLALLALLLELMLNWFVIRRLP